MHLYVVRHGETEQSQEEIFRGKKDISLNKVGKEQAARIGSFFTDKDIDRILSSPLTRAMDTAYCISGVINVPTEAVEELVDMNFGIWEGRTLKEVKSLYPQEFEIWTKSPQRLSLKNGESLTVVRKRVAKTFKKLLSKEQSNIVLVTHRVICKLIILCFLNLPSSHFWDIKCDPGSITLFEKEDNRGILCFMNDTCHLRAD